MAHAVDDLRTYLGHRPEADDHAAVLARLLALRERRWPPLH
jgi:hypothetical protein